MLDSIIRKKYTTHNIAEVSECVQNSYLKLTDYINSPDSQFAMASTEVVEQVIDFFEKIVMTKNHR